ncbi:hypothetical protein [Nostoc sp. ATCC 53789]|uniref:hypothetical protein n=1 Tax=Nostoc sp. ATCC 53789 TaxID=76335 RepID=UPI000DECC6B4|nr:hypothetical protein [Nostoc sp. ATCC 53789]QHG14822.1 hypothetical protein GJB62_01690 [Nostoc sp. ATCC 53789]
MTVSSHRIAKRSESTEEPILTDSKTLNEVIECLVENFSIETQGRCDQKTLFEILIKAASSGDRLRTQLNY